jgi:prephenate dehydratase
VIAVPGVPPARYAYLGPEGTFTEAALRSLPAARHAELLPQTSVTASLEAVRRGEADGAMVPIENSVEGSVTATLDELASGEPLVVTREVLLPVSFALLVRPGTSLDGVKTVAGHPHSQPQCRRWLAATLPRAEWRPAASNADAARLVQEGHFDAALAGIFAAQRYHLVALAEDIHDIEGAVTRFVLVSRPGPPPPPTGADKTSLVAFIRDDHPGALMEILEEFAVRGVNLTRIESRPRRTALGHYMFFADLDGAAGRPPVADALAGLRTRVEVLRVLGSYTIAAGPPG